jgi:glyoxylase-like metal-dependent hydrolase (beta-lactamase superfamily II)
MAMKRVGALGVLLGVGVVSMSVAAFQQPAAAGPAAQAPMVVEVDKLRDNLFVLRNGGGNTAVFIQSAGVTVVDTKNPGWGQPILAKIKELTPKPVVRIINTHTHGDHVSGNVEFPASVEIVTTANTRRNMEKMAPAAGVAPPPEPVPNIFAAHANRGMPTRTFEDRLTIGSGADQIDLRYFGRGHTNGDAWVVFPALRAVHAGDIFPGKQLPIMDSNNGGTAVGYADTLMKAHAALGNVESIITGHGTVMSPNDLREFAEFNRAFVNAVRQGKQAGQNVEAIAAAWTIPATFSGYTPPTPQQAMRVRTNVELAFRELE